MALPLDGYTVSVRSVVRASTGAIAVTLRLSDGSLRTMIVPPSLATFDGVTFTAAAIAQLALLAQETT